MFRCITELKGLAVDIDSFPELKIEDWVEINGIVPCVFLTTDNNTKDALSIVFGADRVLYLAKFEKLFAPSRHTHIKAMTALDVKNTELVYLSCSHAFLTKANGFLSGTIWITDKVTYRQASEAPDMVRNSIDGLKDALRNHMAGFFGEMVVFPSDKSPATMLPVVFEVDDEEVPMYILGRYFGYSHYMNQLHPYSSAIYLNKKQGKSYTGSYDTIFGKIYAAAVRTLKEVHGIDCVCSVPVKPGKRSRFDGILNHIAEGCDVQNVGDMFSCIRNYPDQKGLDTEERERNIKGAFKFSGNLSGHTIALIDDIISTGSTIKECVRELKNSGADEVVLVALAINQFGTTYWSSNSPQVDCPVCNSKMSLYLNSRGQFFYSCLDCFSNHRPSSTMNFSVGWKKLCDKENEKIDMMIPQRKVAILGDYLEDGTINLERVAKCPYCSFNNVINIEDIGSSSSNERSMGTEILYEFDTDDVVCEDCGKAFHVSGFVSIYPPGTVGIQELNIEQLEEDL